ncbi:MAG: PAS domain S-box protein [Rhodospirillaceae bacterium]|jgi:PAS domain S-box-containing protein|nr:PAS domain S-box protein [Rhodospirillaceae bacterium]
MIWQSIWAMTVIDLAVVGMVTYTFAYFMRMRGNILRPSTRFGLLVVGFGLAVVALFYLVDLASMHLLPTTLGERHAMAFMRELYLEYNWFVALIGIGAISLGLLVSGRGLLRVVQDLRDSEGRFRDFAEASAEHYWQTDAQDRYDYFSSSYQESSGRSNEALIGQPIQNATDPDFQKQESWQYVLSQIKQRQPFRDVVFERQGAKPGETVWIRVAGQPYFDDKGKFQGFRGSSTNITENRRAEDALRESERQFRVLAANVAGGLLYMDEEARYVFVNKAYASWFGLESEEFVGNTALEVLGQDVDDNSREYFLTALGGEKVTYEAVRQTTVSGPKDIQVTNVPNIAADGTVEGVFVLVTDVSEIRLRERALEESHKLLQALIDGMPEFIALKDAQGKYLFVNRVFEEWYGRPRDQVIGTTMYDHLTKEEADIYAEEERKVAAQKAPVSREINAKWPDGVLRNAIVIRFPVLDVVGPH